jgi:hypothetical protein
MPWCSPGSHLRWSRPRRILARRYIIRLETLWRRIRTATRGFLPTAVLGLRATREGMHITLKRWISKGFCLVPERLPQPGRRSRSFFFLFSFFFDIIRQQTIAASTSDVAAQPARRLIRQTSVDASFAGKGATGCHQVTSQLTWSASISSTVGAITRSA